MRRPTQKNGLNCFKKIELNNIHVAILTLLWLLSLYIYINEDISKMWNFQQLNEVYPDWIYAIWLKFGVCKFTAFYYMTNIYFFIFFQMFMTAPIILLIHIKRKYIS